MLPPEDRYRTWLVIHHGRVINSVSYQAGCDADYVRRTLIEHDHFPNDITVELERRPPPGPARDYDLRRYQGD